MYIVYGPCLLPTFCGVECFETDTFSPTFFLSEQVYLFAVFELLAISLVVVFDYMQFFSVVLSFDSIGKLKTELHAPLPENVLSKWRYFFGRNTFAFVLFVHTHTAYATWAALPLRCIKINNFVPYVCRIARFVIRAFNANNQFNFSGRKKKLCSNKTMKEKRQKPPSEIILGMH